jgi:hypothetical protein
VGLRTTCTVLSESGIVRENVLVRDNGGDPPETELAPETVFLMGDFGEVGVVAIAGLFFRAHTHVRGAEEFLFVWGRSIGEGPRCLL